MLFAIMSNVSQRFARVPTSRKKVFNNLFYMPENAVVRSGPFVIPKIDDTHLCATAKYSNIAPSVEGKYSKPIFSHSLPLGSTAMKEIKNSISELHSTEQPPFQLKNQYAPKDFTTWQSETLRMPEEKMNTISFYIKDNKSFRPTNEVNCNTRKKKYKSIDSMYKVLRAQILEYIRSKDGIVKRDHGLMSENKMREVGKFDVSFQRILNSTEDFLNSVVVNNLNTNLTELVIDQTASLVEDEEPQRKIAIERSPVGYNETYSDDPEEDSPETQELAESLNHLPLGSDGFYDNAVSQLTTETKTHRFIDPNKRCTKDKEDRFWAPKKKSNTLLSDSFVEKMTEVNYDPVDIGDQELSDTDITEGGDDTPIAPEMTKSGLTVHDSKAAEKMTLEDEVLNKKIDQRICNALDILKNALTCGVSVSELASLPSPSSQEATTENVTQDMSGASSDSSADEDPTCIPTLCPTIIPKNSTKENTFSTLRILLSKKTSTSSSIRKTIRPQLDIATKMTRDTKKLNPTKSISSKKSTIQRENTRRNGIKFHMSQKRLMNSKASDHKDNLSDYEKVFGTKHSRLPISQKAIKAKNTIVTKVSKTSHSRSS